MTRNEAIALGEAHLRDAEYVVKYDEYKIEEEAQLVTSRCSLAMAYFKLAELLEPKTNPPRCTICGQTGGGSYHNPGLRNTFIDHQFTTEPQ